MEPDEVKLIQIDINTFESRKKALDRFILGMARSGAILKKSKECKSCANMEKRAYALYIDLVHSRRESPMMPWEISRRLTFMLSGPVDNDCSVCSENAIHIQKLRESL